MRVNFKCILLVALIMVVFVGCNRTKPQTPSNRPIQDTMAMALIELNQRYAQEAATQLAFYVNEHDENYVLDEMGYWYRIVERGNGVLVTELNQVTLHRQEYAIEDTSLLYKDEVIQVKPEKREVMDAIDRAFEHLHVGDSVSILAPWFLAYGPKGDGGDVLPYTSLRIELRVLAE